MTRAVLLALFALAACDSMPMTTCETNGQPDLIDINGDGRPDIRKFVVRGKEVCRETDLDLDGHPDTILVSDAGRGVSWTGSDFNNDGRCDHVEVRVDGKPTHEIVDTDGDGQPDQRRNLAAP
jgi:hypothetical protein